MKLTDDEKFFVTGFLVGLCICFVVATVVCGGFLYLSSL
jgi:hypothetical protein